ncbi:MAG TPA: SDR family NAD(P)-dependent oxidoreductase [Ignavibacteriaceae bacterium]|nr:SDR family NAD(P)-dependent oxidoreductase [Ignavibacteriaceae bacterium]
MRLSGNTVIITGGTSGIGLVFAEKYLELGSKVVICGRREDRLNDIKKKHPGITTKRCDVNDSAERASLATWVIENYPEVNVLINNAGIQLLADLTHQINLDKVHNEVETNLIAPIHLSSLLVQHLIQKKESAIINISSGLAFVPLSFMPVYCATKAALHSVTLSLRHQLKDTNVKVFEIAPPSVDTELGHERREDKTQTHGGIHVDEFISEAMKAIENDVYESAVGMSENMRQKRESLFSSMNH